MDIFNIASALFGSSRIEDSSGLSNTVDSIPAVGTTASVDGSVGITMDADVTPADDVEDEDTDQTIIDVPTSPAVDAEDDLILGLTGDGPLKVPVVLANPGSGDRQQAQINSAVWLAEAAEAVANATGQHFWPDTDGVHVTEVTQDEWSDSSGTSYHSGANVLLNALGQLFRDGLNNLLALVTGQETGVAIYDGNGNDPENVVASFTGTNVSLGANSNSSTIDMCGGAFKFSVDKSDPDNVIGLIKVDQNAIDDHTADTPTIQILSGTSSDGRGIEILGTPGAQYPVSVVSYGSGTMTSNVGLGSLGVLTPGINFGSASGLVEAYGGLYVQSLTGTNFWSTVPGTILWSSSGHMMTSGHTANLAYNVSTCHSGIVLHFQPYTSGTTRNYFHQYCFVPKTTVAASAGAVHNFTLCNTGFASVGMKALRIYDDRITGDDVNDDTGTATSGIKYSNNQWVMTQVIAV